MHDIEVNFNLSAQGLENGLIFLEDSESNLNIADLLSEGMVGKIRFFNLVFDCLQKLLFGEASDMPHNIFDFDPGAGEGGIVNSRYFNGLTDDGASRRNAILSILITQGSDELVQEFMHLLDCTAVVGNIQLQQFSLDPALVDFLHLLQIIYFKYAAIF